MKLDPEAVRREKEDARRTRQRVEARREQSGNASFSIREADTSLVMSIQAAIDELAARLRNGGAAGTLDSLRATAALDRLLDRDPLDRLAPLPPEPPAETRTIPSQTAMTTSGPGTTNRAPPKARTPPSQTAMTTPRTTPRPGTTIPALLTTRTSRRPRSRRPIAAPAPRPGARRSFPPSSTSSSPPPPSSAGAPPPARPALGA